MSYAVQTRKKDSHFEQGPTISDEKAAQFFYDRVELEPGGIVEKRIIQFSVEREEFIAN
jgi:hypothetical protein